MGALVERAYDLASKGYPWSAVPPASVREL
jgi:hypothetical protein